MIEDLPLALTWDQIREALPKVEQGLRKYCWLQERLWNCDVSTNTAFQTCYRGFYKVRGRGTQWSSVYFGLLEHAKRNKLSFADALDNLLRRTGKLEASFASKLLASVDPNLPVIDRVVLGHFGLRLPWWKSRDRFARTVQVYEELTKNLRAVLGSSFGARVCDAFDENYRWANVTPMKKIDLVLWQVRTK